MDALKEYRELYRQILMLLEEYVKPKNYVQTTKYSVKLNTKETIVFSETNEDKSGSLIKLIKGEDSKPYFSDSNTINCSLTELRSLLLQLELKFDVK